MMANEYSILGASAPIISRVPASIIASASPMVGTETPFVVVPRSAVGTQMMPTFLSADMGAMPMTSQFTSLGAVPSATTATGGTPLYTDSTVLNGLNTGGLPVANTSSLFASSIQPQGTNLSTLGGLGGNITAVPSLASPRSLSALPTENPDSASTVDVAKLIASVMDAKQDDVKTPSSSGSGSKAELLAMIKEVKEEVKQELKASKAGKDNGKTAESTTIPEDKTLVSASPKLSATEKAIG